MKEVKYFIIVWVRGGKSFYFEHEEMGLLDPSTHKTIKEPMGYFTEYKKGACVFKERWQAEAVSASYAGTHIEEVIGKCREKKKKSEVQ